MNKSSRLAPVLRNIAIFLLSAERSRLHADYKLMDLLEERQMLCAYSDPKQEGIQTEGVYVRQTDDYTEYCFTAADHRHSDK